MVRRAMGGDGASENEVIAFLAERLAMRPEKIRPEHSVEGDLHTTGDDADELMQAFFSRFHVAPRGFRFSEHFSPEARWPWELLKRPKYPVRVADLIRAAREKAWSRPTE